MSVRRYLAVRIDPSLAEPARVIGALHREHLSALAMLAVAEARRRELEDAHMTLVIDSSDLADAILERVKVGTWDGGVPDGSYVARPA